MAHSRRPSKKLLKSFLNLIISVFLFAALLTESQPLPPGSPLVPDSLSLDASSGSYIVTYTLNVTLAYGAPSCFARPVVLVSGVFEPTIGIHQGDTLRINLVNSSPATFPSVSEGISIHYHGLRMSGPAAWFDGVSYVSLCPVAPGKSYTYLFLVKDPPGTYLWHDHATGLKGDGLQGALIVYPPRAPATPGAAPAVQPGTAVRDVWSYDGEHVLFLSDWYHATMNSLMFQLNMPFDASRVTNDTGAWSWIGNPQAVLVNGKGFYGDCALFPGSGASAAPPNCTPAAFTVPPGRSAQQPWASNNNPGCSHSSFAVDAGKTYRLRLIAATTLVYLTVCFEGHNVTLIAADAIPTAPVSTRCLDINSGQRLDVLLTVDQPVANYWITVVPQYRVGSPAGYAVLSYTGAPAGTFPTSPAPQPVTITPWGYAEDSLVTMSPDLLAPSSNPALAFYRPTGQASLSPPKTSNTFVLVNLSQPLLQANGQLRWALDNVAMSKTPPCRPLLEVVQKDPRYLERLAVNASVVNGTGGGPFVAMASVSTASKSPVYLDGVSPVPAYPSVGLHIVKLTGGAVVDVVVNNNPANMFNGDYRPGVGATRTAMEQHPFHLHGHHFWILGRGTGVYDPVKHAAGLNTANPAFRDTVTVPTGGWAYLRFVADNPGIWPFHCHILPHVFMGQQLYFVEDITKLARPPAKSPACSGACRYNFAPYNKAYLRSKWGVSGWELPPL